MDKVLKFFPFMPEEKDTGKLVIAILIYVLGIPFVSGILGFILGLTVILAPVAVLLGLACSAYSLAGLVFAILCYVGVDMSGTKKAAEETTEE